MRLTFSLGAAVSVLALSACGGDSGGGGAADGGVAGSNAAVDMTGYNNSNEFGTASLFAEDGDQTRVLLDTEGPFDREFEQPVAIYKGTCPNPSGKPAYKLNVLTDGFSETTIDASLDDLQNGGYIIVVNKSASDDTVTQCGTIESAD
jgi:hypothetical protein